MQADDGSIEGDAAEIIPKLIHIEDSSPEPPPIKEKTKEPDTCARKVQVIPKIAPTTKARKENKAPSGKTTGTARKLASNESVNSSPNA